MSDRLRVRESVFRSGVVSVTCLLRGLPLFFQAAPRTPLRSLGIIALDIIHVLRHARPLPRKKRRELALVLDFEGCANAAWDGKTLCSDEYEALGQRLRDAGLGPLIEQYLGRLQELESRRPCVAGGQVRFEDVRAYREAVARLSLATAAALALKADASLSGIGSAHHDSDVDTLFRILMQCQIIDDVLDYAEDRSASLPSFLTASASVSEALARTAAASRRYAHVSPRDGALPFRFALSLVSALTRLFLRAAPYERTHTTALARIARGATR